MYLMGCKTEDGLAFVVTVLVLESAMASAPLLADITQKAWR